jgi:hypothetical protein
MADSKGFAFLHDGTIYYSPNSTRRVFVPPPTDTSIYQFSRKFARLDRFQQPQWWSEPYGFLAFVPLIPKFDGLVFGCLREILAYIHLSIDGKHVLCPEKVAQWEDLEDLLFLISSLLKNEKKFLFGASLTPIAPSHLGYGFPSNDLRAARLRVTAARDWFVVLMAHLSFLFGHFEHDDNLGYPTDFTKCLEIPRWFIYLENRGIPQDWLCGLQTSTVCDFSSRCPRVGLFLDFLEDHKGRQPQVKWYTFLNIPVWYPWTAKHEKAVTGKQRRELEYLQPPAEVLQVAATILIRTPTAILPSALLPPSASPSSAPPPPCSAPSPSPAHSESHEPHSPQPASDLRTIQLAIIATKPWQKFFEARDELNKKKQANETPAQREIRLNRARKPPIKKVDVFRWDWSDDDPKQLVRTKVTRREGEEIITTYDDPLLVYDPFSNVWDACEYFGEPDNAQDVDFPMSHPPSSATCSAGVTPTDATPSDVPCPSVDDNKGTSERMEHEAFFRDRLHQLSSSRPSDQFKKLFLSYTSDSHDLVQDSFDIIGYLAFHYGFVPPLPLQSNAPVNVADWEESIKNVGLDVSKNSPSVDYSATVVNFVKGFLSTAGPSVELWDLRPGNRRAVDNQRLSQTFRKKRDDLFFLNSSYLRGEPRFSWTIALTTAADALFVYRLLNEKDFSALSLMFLLIDEGIRFRTLQALMPTIQTSITVKAPIPIRVKNYVFNESDFHSYVLERKRILSSSRGRAALLEGGIISRIAREHIGHDRAVIGPSTAVTVHRQGFSFTDSTGVTYWDDKLTDDEIGSICGLYRCYTGKKNSLYFYPSLLRLLQAMANRCRMFRGGQLPRIGITARLMATTGGTGLSGMNIGIKIE